MWAARARHELLFLLHLSLRSKPVNILLEPRSFCARGRQLAARRRARCRWCRSI